MERTEKKLREGGFFYRKLFERDRMAFGEPEEWAFYLRAFLNAGRSVDYRLRHEQSSYPTFGEVWNGLHPAEDHFMKFMSLDRADEVHHGGSKRVERERRIFYWKLLQRQIRGRHCL
jgi:hypothetical protein